MISKAVEDYLKAIFTLQSRHDTVTTNAIAKYLGISAPSVTGMLRNMASRKLVNYKPYKGVRLTRSGRIRALKTIRSHRLIELYLVKVLGVPWENVHLEAEKWEHVISEDIEDRIDKHLGYPTRDPHGAVIPSRDGQINLIETIELSKLKGGESGIIEEVIDDNPELLAYFSKIGIIPGIKLAVENVSVTGDVFKIKLRKKIINIGIIAAENILIRK